MANDFTDAYGLQALYRCENGALTTDSSGNGNDLTNSGVAVDTVNYHEGAASGDWELDDADIMYRADAYLSADFPLKAGTANYDFTITGWLRPESLSVSYVRTPWSKNKTQWNNGHDIWITSDDFRLWLQLTIQGRVANSSGSLTISTGQWYFFACSYDSSTGTIRAYLYDLSATSVIQDQSSTFDPSTYGYPSLAAAGNWNHGGTNLTFTLPWDGNMDEITVWNRPLTTAEIEAIRDGTYTGSSSSSSHSSSSSNSSSSSSSASSSSSFVPPTWPTLSKGVEFDVQELPGSDDVTLPLGNGRDKVRPRYTRRPHRWRIKYRLLPLADYLALETFYLVTCRRSKYTFEWTDSGMDQVWLVRFDPGVPPRWRGMPEQPDKYTFDAVLKEETIGTYGAGGYGAQYYDS